MLLVFSQETNVMNKYENMRKLTDHGSVVKA